jgi:hypothetical protein
MCVHPIFLVAVMNRRIQIVLPLLLLDYGQCHWNEANLNTIIYPVYKKGIVMSFMRVAQELQDIRIF